MLVFAHRVGDRVIVQHPGHANHNRIGTVVGSEIGGFRIRFDHTRPYRGHWDTGETSVATVASDYLLALSYDLAVVFHPGPRGGGWYGFAHDDGSAAFLLCAFAERHDDDPGYCEALCRRIWYSSPDRTEDMMAWTRTAAERHGIELNAR